MTPHHPYEELEQDCLGRTRAILDRSSEAFIEADSRGLITDWNPAAENFFGWPAAEALRRPLLELIIPTRNHELFRETLRRFTAADAPPPSPEHVEITALRRGGSELDLELTLFPVRSSSGKHRVAAFARDLDLRKHADAETEKLHRDLMDQLAEPYVEVDLRGRFVFVNRAYCEVYQVDPADRVNASYKSTIPPGWR